MSIVSFPLFLTIAILSFFGSEESNPPLPVFEDGPSQKRVVQSEVTTLNVPVSEIDDGAVYYIRNVGYSNRYWDVYYANYTNVNYYMATVTNPRELSVRHYDLLTGERIHSRNFETIMNNGMAEAASYYE